MNLTLVLTFSSKAILPVVSSVTLPLSGDKYFPIFSIKIPEREIELDSQSLDVTPHKTLFFLVYVDYNNIYQMAPPLIKPTAWEVDFCVIKFVWMWKGWGSLWLALAFGKPIQYLLFLSVLAPAEEIFLHMCLTCYF